MKKRWKLKKQKGKGKKLIIIILVGVAGLFFLKQISRYANMKNQKNELNTEIEQLKEDNEILSKKVKNIHGDKEHIEKIAREKLNMVKEGETTFIIKDE